MNSETWNKVMAMESKDTRHGRAPFQLANNLTTDEIETILATMEFFGASMPDLQQTAFDLKIPRYRVFDWLAMAIMGRIECRLAVQVLVHSFLKVDGDIDRFIADLRTADYDLDHSWQEVEV